METRAVIPGLRTGNPSFRIGETGGDPLHQEGLGGVPPSFIEADNREAATTMR